MLASLPLATARRPAARAVLQVGRAAAVAFGVAIASLLLLRLLPGDAVELRFGGGEGTPIPRLAAAEASAALGLDRPFPEQAIVWAGRAVRGDLGNSLADGRPVARRIAERVPATLLLQGAAMALALGLAVPLGTVLAWRAGSPVDRAARLALLAGFALPGFWVALLLQGWLAVRWGWLPMQGMATATGTGRGGSTALDVARHLLLPAVCLAVPQFAFVARFARATVLEVLGREAVRTARAKGLSDAALLRRHALRQALGPLLTLAGMAVPALVGGSIVIETIFSWPGLGRLFQDAVQQRDYPVIQALMLLAGAATVAGNLIANRLAAALDPRTADPLT
jgi:peptide/nickel transport system permease protein